MTGDLVKDRNASERDNTRPAGSKKRGHGEGVANITRKKKQKKRASGSSLDSWDGTEEEADISGGVCACVCACVCVCVLVRYRRCLVQ